MKTLIWIAAICLVGAGSADLAAAARPVKTPLPGQAASPDCDQKDAESAIASWPGVTKAAARALIEKYGPPTSVTVTGLGWASEKQKVMRVWLYRFPSLDNDPLPHRDFIENTIDYRVPPDKVAELVRFDHALVIDVVRAKLTTHSDSEKNNILAFNLADEIVTGARNVASARDIRRKTIQESLAGKSSPYTEKLLFKPVER